MASAALCRLLHADLEIRLPDVGNVLREEKERLCHRQDLRPVRLEVHLHACLLGRLVSLLLVTWKTRRDDVEPIGLASLA